MKELSIEIKWALIFSAVSIAWIGLERLSGLHDSYLHYHPYLTNLFALPAIAVMVAALRQKKKVYFQSKMSYRQGLISGLMLSVIIALLAPLATWISMSWVSPHYLEAMIELSLEEGYHASQSEAEEYFNLRSYLFQSSVGALFMGVLTTSIAMIFLRSK